MVITARVKWTRDSGIELMRLFAIFSVIMYHFLAHYTISFSPDNKYGYVLWLPFRTAVTLFVLTSGFYGIHFSWKGLIRLISKAFILFTPFEIVSWFLDSGGGIKN